MLFLTYLKFEYGFYWSLTKVYTCSFYHVATVHVKAVLEEQQQQCRFRSRTSTLSTQWRLHAAAFHDRLASKMCLCQVALSCSHCDVVNQTLQIRCSGYRSAVAFSSPRLQITANVRCPALLSVWHYLLNWAVTARHSGGPPFWGSAIPEVCHERRKWGIGIWVR